MGVFRYIALLTLISFGVMPISGPAFAQDFYKGKTLTIVVGFASGGGMDVAARLLSRHIGNFIPGHPAVIVQNMPGAGSMNAVRYLDATAPKDGTVITAFHFGLIGQSRLMPKNVPLDFRQYAWVGSISEDYAVCYVWHTLGVKNLADLKTHKNLHFGLTGIGTDDDIFSRILKNIFGADVHQVGGYPGSAEELLAIERGELDGNCGHWSTLPVNWIEHGLITSLYRSGESIPSDMSPDVPYMMDIAPSDRDRSIIRVLVSDRDLGRPYIASLKAPVERINILREAFNGAVKDPQFAADAEKVREPVSPRSATEALKVVEGIYATPADIVEVAQKFMAQ